MAITVSDAWTNVQDVVKDISDVSTDQRLRGASYVNQAFYEALYDNDADQIAISYALTINPSQSTYALPADFQTLNGTNCGVYNTNQDLTISSQQFPLTSPGANTQGYYISGSNLIVTPLPQQTANWIIRYVPLVDNFTDVTDTFCVPDRYIEHLKRALLEWYQLFDRNDGGEAIAGQRFRAVIDDFVKTINKAAKVGVVPDISSFY